MSQQPNAWQTNSRTSSSRTSQNRSGTASPSQQNQNQPPKNVWTQQQQQNRSNVNGPSKGDVTPGFNAAEAKAFLGRLGGQGGATTYKVPGGAGEGRGGGTGGAGGAWGSKANTMANGQPFFAQLAKGVAVIEGGG